MPPLTQTARRDQAEGKAPQPAQPAMSRVTMRLRDLQQRGLQPRPQKASSDKARSLSSEKASESASEEESSPEVTSHPARPPVTGRRGTQGREAGAEAKGGQRQPAPTTAQAKPKAQSDSFGQLAKVDRSAIMPSPPGPLLTKAGASGTLSHILNHARDPGEYFKEDQHDGRHPEDEEDPELRAAVEEAIRLLFGVRGIHHIGPGKDDMGEPVIVIAAGRGFTQVALKRVPAKVHRFRTVLALPYDLLPLRREREA